RKLLPMQLVERGFGIEQFHLAWATHHEKKNAPLGPRREVGAARCRGCGPGARRTCGVASQQMSESHRAETLAGRLEEATTGPRAIQGRERTGTPVEFRGFRGHKRIHGC